DVEVQVHLQRRGRIGPARRYVARGGLKADVRAVRAGHHGPGRTRDGDLTAGDRGVERGQLPRLRAIERHPAVLDRVRHQTSPKAPGSGRALHRHYPGGGAIINAGTPQALNLLISLVPLRGTAPRVAAVLGPVCRGSRTDLRSPRPSRVALPSLN